MSRSNAALRHATAVLVAVFVLGACDTSSMKQHTPGWTDTGQLMTARAFHSMVALDDGGALVLGGFHRTFGTNDPFTTLATAERWSPGSGTWSPAGEMAEGRRVAAAVRLRDGRVLVAGGLWLPANPGQVDAGPVPARLLTSAELYDPAIGAWSETGPMASPRYGSGALLPDGRVLVVGGIELPDPNAAGNTVHGRCELYDPATGSWSVTGSLATPRQVPALVALADGEILAVGGMTGVDGRGGTAAAERYDPGTGTWRPAGQLDYTVSFATPVLLPTGEVLLVGGCVGGDGNCSEQDVQCSLFDPATNQWRRTGSTHWARAGAPAMVLPSGDVLVVGAPPWSGSGARVESYDRATETWSEAAPLLNDHGNGVAGVRLSDGSFLVTGGLLASGPWVDAFMYTVGYSERYE